MSAHSHGQRSPGYSPGDREELDMTERLSTHTCCAMTRHTVSKPASSHKDRIHSALHPNPHASCLGQIPRG